MITDNFRDTMQWTMDDALLEACGKIEQARNRMKPEFQATDREIEAYLSARYGEDIGQWYYEFITEGGHNLEAWRP